MKGKQDMNFTVHFIEYKKIAFAYICMTLFLIGCTNVAEDSHMATSNGSKMKEISKIVEDNTDILGKEVEDLFLNEHVYEQNDAYKLFYGTWEVTSIVSEHGRLGGDEGYEDILGMQITYLPDKYEFGGIVSIDNPNYLMSVFPINSYFLSDQRQASVTTLMPDSDYFVWVQIVDKPTTETGMDYGFESYVGNEFFVGDDNTLYSFDYNCIYELKRVSYMDDYDPQYTPAYHERW